MPSSTTATRTVTVTPMDSPTPSTSNVSRIPMPGMARRVIGIVAAYPSLRAGLGALIQQDSRFVASTISPDTILAWSQIPTSVAIAGMDAVLVDSRDLAPETLEAMVQIAQSEDVPLLWLAHNGRLPGAATTNAPGGIISSRADGDTLIAAISAIRAGLRVYDPDLELEAETGSPGASVATAPIAGAVQSLSPREREVLELVASGLPNKAIARTLGISDHTVKFHVSSVLAKLDAGSRTEAVTIASRTGILSL